MDKKDKRLLYHLSKNSRESVKYLSKTIRLSPPSTIYRLTALRQQGILRAYHCIIDNSLLGYKGFRLYFSFTKTLPEQENEILQWLVAQKAASVVAQCYGGIDVAIMSWVADEREFYAFFKEFKRLWGKYTHKLDFFIYQRTAHFARSYLEDKPSEYLFTTGMGSKSTFDELDMQILSLLSEDARDSALSLSTHCTVSAKTIIERIRRLERDRIIAGYGISIDTAKLGIQYYKLNITLETPLEEHQIISFASTLKGVVYIDFTLGRFDIELNLEVHSYDDIEKIIQTTKEANPNIVSIELFQIRKYRKLRFI
jgi:Lrp/AsnC family leucine-responsive transcriptional regulator